MIKWLNDNRDWLFQGGGVVVIAALWGVLARSMSRRRHQQLRYPPTQFTTSTPVLKCSFCGRTQREVRTLIAGPGVFICDTCADLSDEILDEDRVAGRASGVIEIIAATIRVLEPGISGAKRADLQDEIERLANSVRPSRRPRPGDQVAGAHLVRIVGTGNFGTVWEAVDLKSGEQKVAVKIFDPDKLGMGLMLWRFQRGIRAMQHLSGINGRIPPSICRIREVSPDTLSFSMEYLPGGDLVRLSQLGWHFEKKLEVFEQVCAAVRFAHHNGVVHRDIKPANIVLDVLNEPVLTDFDIADLAFASTQSMAAASLGTPHFAAPEQLLGTLQTAHPTADIFSLGKLLYYLLSEQSPPMGCLESHVPNYLVNPAWPTDFSRVIHRSLQCEPSDRFQSVDEMLRALGADPEAWS